VIEGKVAWTGDYINDPSFLHAESSDFYVREIGIQSVMSAPLLDGGVVFGALTIYTRRFNAWGTEDARLIEAIANQASIAISTANLIEELDRSSAKLARRAEAQQSLLEIAARITAIREPGPLLQQVVDAASRLVGGDGSILDLVEPGRNVLRWAYDSGIGEKFTEDELTELNIPVGIGASGIAVAEGRVIVAGDDPAALFPESAVNSRFFGVTGFRSMIIAPISGEAGPLGALEVYSTELGAFDDDDAGVIRSLAYQAAIAIQNARLIEELERSRTEIARRLKDLPLVTSFRSAYAYDNVLYLIAGEVIESVSGQSWEDFVSSRILKKVGMNLQVKMLDSAAHRIGLRSGDFALSFTGGNLEADPSLAYGESKRCEPDLKKRRANLAGHCDKEMDRLLDQADQESDLAKRRALIKQILQKHLDDAAEIYIGYAPRFFSMRDYVRGFSTPGDDVYQWWGGGLNQTWLDK
jgi:GAF domain-containing protein